MSSIRLNHSSIILICVIVRIFLGPDHLFAQNYFEWNDNSWQSESAKPPKHLKSFEQYTPQKISVGNDGSVDLGIPLLSVPSRNGLSFDLGLKYTSGVQVGQEASWVGLGWNLPIGSITRNILLRMDENITTTNPNITYDGESYDGYRDTYDVLCPAGNEKILQFPSSTVTNGFDLVLEDSRPWKVTYDVTKHRFVIVVEDGTTYVFGFGLVGITSNVGKYYWEYCNGLLPVPAAEPYMQWLLTAILSPDYHDGGGDALDPLDVASP